MQSRPQPVGAAFAIGRVVFALAGSTALAVLVALFEGIQAAGQSSGARAPGVVALVLADLGVLAPVAAVVGAVVAFCAVALEPDRPVPPTERLATLRAEPVPGRARSAAVALLAAVAVAAWLVITAGTARGMVGAGAPMATGWALAVTAVAWLLALASSVLALVPVVRRGLASAGASRPWAVDPAAAAGAGVVLVALVLTLGVWLGDTGGQGATPLAIFGVLKRPELDLWPTFDLAAMAACAWLAPYALRGRSPGVAGLAIALAFVVVPPVLTGYEASALERDPAPARSIEQFAPLGKTALAILRRATDRDHDGASPYFGGGDCNDGDPNISPLAVAIPGNGIDEDCSGADLPAVGAAAVARGAAAAPDLPVARAVAVERDYNLILVTIDTLRAADVGFLGYDKPTTPNLDALAAQSVVFDRAYSMASYTGKALAPMLIGKYPSETVRDGGHFNRYAASNTFLAERLKRAGVFGMGAASHWYFRESWGLTQGFDAFDLSAIPEQGQSAASDSTTTSAELTDAALKLLSARAGGHRFFLWVHYFDPHEQYVPHAGAPDFADPARPAGWRMHAAYDGEVWFTDKHLGRLLDYARSQRWWDDTIVVVTSDHGESMSEHGLMFQHGFEIWEPLVRVPFLIRVPGLSPHHVPVKRSVIDLVPTLLELMRAPAAQPGELSGQSLMPDLSARPGDRYAERDVFIDMPDGPFTHMRRAIIHGNTPGMKLIHFGGRQYQLYDLALDPGELEDLSDDPEKLGPLVEAMQAKRSTLREIYVKPDVIPGP